MRHVELTNKQQKMQADEHPGTKVLHFHKNKINLSLKLYDCIHLVTTKSLFFMKTKKK